ncbi:MAG: hypothetical protein HN689_07060 [Euryarchaeota archaeon]|nr:hypothetical protein [Euryarchaeota archaeon]
MADALDVVARSFNINSKLGPKLTAAAEQNAILRIGWTNAGDPVPKNGELGLCPGLPKGAKVRALGKLGSWTAAFGNGGTFTIQGDVESYLGAGNGGNTITCERSAGNYAGYGMKSGKISILDGCGDDLGSCMEGGLLFVRGNAGVRVGGGMKDGIIVVDGDIGNDPGAGMSGGLIIINGRCPDPPEGVTLRPVTKSELTKINKELDIKDFQIPNDSVCLECTNPKNDSKSSHVVSSGDMSTIGLVPTDAPHKMNYITCDTVALIGERGDTNTPIALPLPLMPVISDGDILSKFESDGSSVNRIDTQPFIVSINPRTIDFALISHDNLNIIGPKLTQCGGMVIDMMRLPSMNSEEIDGMLVSLRSLLGQDKPFAFSNGVGRIDYLHKTSAYHRADMAISSIEDGTGISEPASLPLIGRSNKANLEDYYTESVINLGFSANADDIVKFCAAGLKLVCCATPAEDGSEINNWLNVIHYDLSTTLQRIGLESIDSLSRQNLRALDHETAAVSGLRLVGYERPLPHWFAR